MRGFTPIVLTVTRTVALSVAIHSGGAGLLQAQGGTEAVAAPPEVAANIAAMKGIAWQDSLTVTVVGGGSNVAQSTDGGDTWVERFRDPTCVLEGVAFATRETGVAVGWQSEPLKPYAGRIVRTTDGGRSWAPVSAPAGVQWLRAVAFADAQNGVAVGDNGIVIRTTDAGATWAVVKSGTEEELRAVKFAGTKGWVVGREVLLTTNDAGKKWRAEKRDRTPYYGLAFLNARQGVLVGDGVFARTEDGGEHWSGGAAGLAEYAGEARRMGYATGSDVMLPVMFGGVAMPAPGIIVTTNPYIGAIARSEDGGNSWHPRETGSRTGFAAVGFGDPKNGLALGREGIVRTRDGGVTWASTGAPSTRLAAGALGGTWTVRITQVSVPQMRCAFDPTTTLTLTDGDSTLAGTLGAWTLACDSTARRTAVNLATETTSQTTTTQQLSLKLVPTPVTGRTDRLRSVRLEFDASGVRGRLEGALWSATTIDGYGKLTVPTQELGVVEVEIRWRGTR